MNFKVAKNLLHEILAYRLECRGNSSYASEIGYFCHCPSYRRVRRFLDVTCMGAAGIWCFVPTVS